MPRRYDAFLVRTWALDDGASRVEVTHLQSGKRILVASLAQATGWISTSASDAAPDRAPPELEARATPLPPGERLPPAAGEE
jgi:hypothetical protein